MLTARCEPSIVPVLDPRGNNGALPPSNNHPIQYKLSLGDGPTPFIPFGHLTALPVKQHRLVIYAWQEREAREELALYKQFLSPAGDSLSICECFESLGVSLRLTEWSTIFHNGPRQSTTVHKSPQKSIAVHNSPQQSAAFFSQKREERGLWPVLRIKLTNFM